MFPLSIPSNIIAVGGANRHACEREHIQHIGVAKLILERKAYEIKFTERVAAFERVEGETLYAHLPVHIKPGSKHALAPHAVHVVHDAVQDPHAQVGHADLVGVREAEREADIHLGFVLYHRRYILRGILL